MTGAKDAQGGGGLRRGLRVADWCADQQQQQEQTWRENSCSDLNSKVKVENIQIPDLSNIVRKWKCFLQIWIEFVAQLHSWSLMWTWSNMTFWSWTCLEMCSGFANFIQRLRWKTEIIWIYVRFNPRESACDLLWGAAFSSSSHMIVYTCVILDVCTSWL